MTRTSIAVSLVVVILAGAAWMSWELYDRSHTPGPLIQPITRPTPSPSPAAVAMASPTPVVSPSATPSALPTAAASPTPSARATATPSPASGGLVVEYVEESQIGRGAFAGPVTAMALDNAHGLLYAAGSGRDILCFDVKSLALLRRFTTPGREVLSLGVDSDGDVYVGEAGRAEKYTRGATGAYTRAMKIGDQVLGRVTAIEVVGGDILCADATAKRLRRFAPTGAEKKDKRIPADVVDLGRPATRVIVPNDRLDFAGTLTGQIVMCHPGRHQVETYDLDGKQLKKWGQFDEHAPGGFTGCCNPVNVAVFPLYQIATAGSGLAGRGLGIVTAEKGPPRVKLYDEAGTLVALIGPAAFDANNTHMELAADSDGRIYVADTQAKVIRRFKVNVKKQGG